MECHGVVKPCASYCIAGDYRGGIVQYKKALETDPSNVQAQAGLARAMLAKQTGLGPAMPEIMGLHPVAGATHGAPMNQKQAETE